MSDATDKLARTRQAILEHVARRERRHDPREETAQGFAEPGSPPYEEDDLPRPGEGWFGHMKRAVRTWWRYHPAHMVADLATPLVRHYAREKPVQLLGVSLAAGAVLMFARPWKLISIGTIVVAVLKSGQLSHLITAAMSASDYRKDHDRPQ